MKHLRYTLIFLLTSASLLLPGCAEDRRRFIILEESGEIPVITQPLCDTIFKLKNISPKMRIYQYQGDFSSFSIKQIIHKHEADNIITLVRDSCLCCLLQWYEPDL